MKELLFIIWVILFIIGFIKVELFLIYKSRQKFLEFSRAYKELKEAEQNLHNLLKDKELEK